MSYSKVFAVCLLWMVFQGFVGGLLSAQAEGCGDQNSTCMGCGCKGGPGYRSLLTRQCVGFRALSATCGTPPTQRCAFENAPGTGANKECALRKRVRSQRKILGFIKTGETFDTSPLG